ncbi:uncharacterized protein LOC128093280 [Culex pipiens pallens]|uniref:uncharacterized protein LOC128093280 n=1 Tax=Culex pipiens pallens TaxID=42434 RepID=UPI0022AA6726|nr:uncharacterized protein LOC128093280 [Culex pipiens pallens]
MTPFKIVISLLNALIASAYLCQLSDCTLGTPSNCSLKELRIERTFPVTPRTIRPGRKFHLFDFFYDPNGTECVFINFAILTNETDRFFVGFGVSIDKAWRPNDWVEIMFELTNQSSEKSPNCFRPIEAQKRCHLGKFRFTVIDNESVLIQDLSPEVPPKMEMLFRERPRPWRPSSEECIPNINGRYRKLLNHTRRCLAGEIGEILIEKQPVVEALVYMLMLWTFLLLLILVVLCEYLFVKFINIREYL